MLESADTRAIAGPDSRERFALWADWLAVGVALALPWSTSATDVLVVLWLIALLPTLNAASIRATLATPAGSLPIVLWTLGIAGILWSDAGREDVVQALKGFHRLLLIPLLMIQFRRSGRGMWVAQGFLVSCTALLVMSWIAWVWDPYSWRFPGVPVKDYIVQSGEFLLCAYALTHRALDAWQQSRRHLALALAVLALVFLVNATTVATARSSLIVFAVLVPVIGLQRFGWKGMLPVAVVAGVLVAVAWVSSPYLRQRVLAAVDEVTKYQAGNIDTSAGYRLEYWRNSVEFFSTAPILGHGTGSIDDLFRRATAGEGKPVVTGNPHNVTLEIAVQFGLLGLAVLYAMWISHLLLFRGAGLPSWIGIGVVVQDIVSSLFLSSLFDFSSGWIYVFGVGVLGGIVLRARSAAPL